MTINAQIKKTMLGFEDHGVFTIWLILEYGGGGQGYGGYCLDGKPKESLGQRTPTEYACKCITSILRTLEVDSWEALQGQYIRVLKDDEFGPIKQIGHLLKDKWFSFEEVANEYA